MSDKILIEYEVEVSGLKAQMKEVQESLRATEKAGVEGAEKVEAAFDKTGESTKSLKTQLKELKAQLANTTDPKEFNRLAAAAGKVQDKINDAADATRAFAKESKAATAKTLFSQVASDIASLDFKGAADKARQFAAVMRTITFAELMGGIKDLGSSLISLGKSLIAPPIGIIIAIAAAVAAAISLGKSMYEASLQSQTLTDAIASQGGALKAYTDRVVESNIKIQESLGLITKGEAELLRLQRKNQQDAIDLRNEYSKQVIALAEELELDLRKVGRNGLFNEISLTDTKRTNKEKFNKEILKLDALYSERAKEALKAQVSEEKAINIVAGNEEKKRKADLQKEINEKQLQLAKELRDLRASIIEDEKERELAQLVNKFTDLSQGLEQGSDKLLLLEEKYRQERNAIIKKYDDAEKALMDKNIEESKASVKKKGDAILQAGRDMHKQLLTDKDAADAKEISAEEKKQQMLKIIIRDSFAFSSELLSQLGQISANMAQQEIQDSEIKANRELEILKSQYESGLISRVEYEKKTKALDDKARKEQADIRRKQFEQEKAISLIKIAISTAQGIANALEGDPYTVAYRVAFAALTGAAQAAVVASQPTPKFAKGVVDLKGKGTKTSDEIPALLSRGESVITADATATDKELFKAFNKGKGQKYIYEVYVAPALKEQLKKHSLSKDSSFAQNIANSMMLNSGKLNDGNILESLKMNRRLEKENTEKLIRAIKLNNTNIRSIV